MAVIATFEIGRGRPGVSQFRFPVGGPGSSTIAVFQPRGPHQFDHWRWSIMDKAAPKAVKEAMVRCLHVWPIGLADADDGENWGGIQAGLSGPMAQSLKLNYQMGMGAEGGDAVYHGMTNPNMIGEFP